MAKSNHKKVFGAFTTVPWRLPDGSDVVRASRDPDSFLFNLSKVHKIVPYNYIDLAVRHYSKDYLVIFGNAAEICIREDYDQRTDNFSGYGSTY